MSFSEEDLASLERAEEVEIETQAPDKAARRTVTWVVVEEVKSGDWGIGGNAVTTEYARALAAGVPA